MARPLTPGTVFAEDFEVRERIDAGGMGEVFLVHQLSTGRSRALKVMRAQLVEDPGLRQRFAQEARVGGQIESEHVVEVVAAGVDARTGLPWLAMEHLDGENLTRHVERRGPLSAAELLRVLQQVCHALGAAHRAGIVHRDLKPENVYLARARRADAAYTVKLLDFGLAKALHSVTHVGTAALGSPVFMAPEQFKGSSVGPETDVWALGLLAFYLLTGRNYQLSAQSPRVDVVRLAREARRGARTLASFRAQELGATVVLPIRFDWWFQRCVAANRLERFPDASVAFEQLARALAHSGPRPAQPRRSAPKEKRVPAAIVPRPSASTWDGVLLVVLGVLGVLVTLVMMGVVFAAVLEV